MVVIQSDLLFVWPLNELFRTPANVLVSDYKCIAFILEEPPFAKEGQACGTPLSQTLLLLLFLTEQQPEVASRETGSVFPNTSYFVFNFRCTCHSLLIYTCKTLSDTNVGAKLLHFRG